jgi:hypothetical protein
MAIRHTINTGLLLGNDWIRAEAEHLPGQRHHQLKRSPKSKSIPSPEFLP